MPKVELFLLLILVLGGPGTAVGKQRTPTRVDVIHYEAEIEPDIPSKTIAGKVKIRISNPGLQSSKSNKRQRVIDTIEFDRGELTIDAVREG